MGTVTGIKEVVFIGMMGLERFTLASKGDGTADTGRVVDLNVPVRCCKGDRVDADDPLPVTAASTAS